MIVDANIFPKLLFGEVAAPPTPAAGTVILYAKADGKMYAKDDAGAETQLGGIAGGALSIQTVTSAATVTPVATNDKVVISSQAVGLTLANPSGTAAEGQGFVIALKDNGTARSIAFGTDYRAMGAALPTTTVLGKWLYIPVMYNSTDAKWDVLAASQQA